MLNQNGLIFLGTADCIQDEPWDFGQVRGPPGKVGRQRSPHNLQCSSQTDWASPKPLVTRPFLHASSATWYLGPLRATLDHPPQPPELFPKDHADEASVKPHHLQDRNQIPWLDTQDSSQSGQCFPLPKSPHPLHASAPGHPLIVQAECSLCQEYLPSLTTWKMPAHLLKPSESFPSPQRQTDSPLCSLGWHLS